MPELLRLKTEDFEFSVWTADIESKVQTWLKTQARFGEENSTEEYSIELFSRHGSLNVEPQPRNQTVRQGTDGNELKKITYAQPVFFENALYQCEWIFSPEVDEARLFSRRSSLKKAFRFVPARKGQSARLTGTLETKNDVGKMTLNVLYSRDGQEYSSVIAFHVLPTKMDLDRDLPVMYRTIDETYPLWRYSLSSNTEAEVSRSDTRGDFPLMWLSSFSRLRLQLMKALRVVTQAPHNQLQKYERRERLGRCDGRISQRQAESMRNDMASGRFDRYYRIERKRLSVDTPENRFVKMVVAKSVHRLEEFAQSIFRSGVEQGESSVSKDFLVELNNWTSDLKRYLLSGFFRQIGPYEGMAGGSLVLQGKTGYRTIFRIWDELKFYLDAFQKCSNISMKSVSEIYEIWCFLTIGHILENDLGFKLVESRKSSLELNAFFEYQLKDGMAGAFEYVNEDGIEARLAHEPVFNKRSRNIRAYCVPQKPDILLEVSFPVRDGNKRKFIWVFDAKYRIKDSDSPAAGDLVPDDAINQMHRYRDSLIHYSTLHALDGKGTKTRPVFGAFALYPGFFNQPKTENPYEESIREIGIGAFALLPTGEEDRTGTFWLRHFLREKILGTMQHEGVRQRVETISAADPVRIPVSGLEKGLYSDLLLIVPDFRTTSSPDNRKELRIKAEFFKDPLNLLPVDIHNVVGEIRFVALAETDFSTGQQTVSKLLVVEKTELINDEYVFTTGLRLSMGRTFSFEKSAPMFTTLTAVEKMGDNPEPEYVYCEQTAH